MKHAIIADIHGNLEAFEAVLEDIERRNIKKIYNCGDLVGYGANPNEVVELNRKKDIITVKGNHEEAIIDPEKVWYLCPQKEHEWTSKECNKDTLDYILLMLLQSQQKNILMNLLKNSVL